MEYPALPPSYFRSIRKTAVLKPDIEWHENDELEIVEKPDIAPFYQTIDIILTSKIEQEMTVEMPFRMPLYAELEIEIRQELTSKQ